jgi:hypothetical protein
MMAHAPHPGAMPPGMAHGQPMGFPPGPNPAQHMGQPMQMHPGAVSGPNGPHMAQPGPMMGGMQPGMGGPMQNQPTAHAMAHLNPAQAHMYAQQQQQVQQASE